MEAATHLVPIGLLLAAAEFDSEGNHTYVRQQLHARSIIPAKRGKKTWRIHGVGAERRRALVETVFSTVKRKLSARAPGRSLFRQLRQALLLGLAYNLYRLWPAVEWKTMSTELDRF